MTNYPSQLLDAQIHVDMLYTLGKQTTLIGDDIIITKENCDLSSGLVWDGSSIRNSLLILRTLAARFGQARVSLPVGCKL